jgi:hypothetical protein
MVQNRIKGILFFGIGVLSVLFILSSAIAGPDYLEVKVICPSKVPVGGTVVIGLQVTNHSMYVPVQINKSAVVAAYPGAQILGPYTMSLSGIVEPGQTITVPNYAAYNISSNIPNGTLIGHGVCLFGVDFNDPLKCGYAITEVSND